jgi:hypothetical protein
MAVAAADTALVHQVQVATAVVVQVAAAETTQASTAQ